MENDILKLKDKSGNIKEYRIILIFNDNNKNYVIYTDNIKNNDKSINVYASVFNPNDLSFFDSVLSYEEWKMIEERLNLLGGIKDE